MWRRSLEPSAAAAGQRKAPLHRAKLQSPSRVSQRCPDHLVSNWGCVHRTNPCTLLPAACTCSDQRTNLFLRTKNPARPQQKYHAHTSMTSTAFVSTSITDKVAQSLPVKMAPEPELTQLITCHLLVPRFTGSQSLMVVGNVRCGELGDLTYEAAASCQALPAQAQLGFTSSTHTTDTSRIRGPAQAVPGRRCPQRFF